MSAGESTALERVGTAGVRAMSLVGSMGVLSAQIFTRLIRLDFDYSELVRNLYRMGVRSLPIVVVTALFTGGIMVIQAAPIVERYGVHQMLGWGAGFGTLREIGPLLVALMISGRVGANNTAELGTMVVTEQVDALRALAIDPVSFLLVPRFVGIVVTLFLSTIFAVGLALFGAAYVGWGLLGVTPITFYHGLTAGLLDVGDLMHGLLKSVVFGGIVALSSCRFGIATEGGAPGVGRAVNSTVVVSAMGIFMLDYVVSFAFG